MKGAQLLPWITGQHWALEPRVANTMRAVIDRWARGEGPPLDTMDRVRADSADRERRRSNAAATGSIAVIPVYGVLTQRGNMMDDVSGPGTTSTQMLSSKLREALADETVRAILLDIDSPGGSVYGIQELADEIYQARSKKPVTAVANSLAASAAYWLGSQASEFYVTPGGEVGSIGVIASHGDWSKANEMAGVKVTYVTAGKYKSEMNPDEPLTYEARAYEQSRVNDYYGAFTRAVARGRDFPVATVRSDAWGAGRTLSARSALDVGMVDGIRSYNETLQGLRMFAPTASTRESIQQRHLAARIRIASR